MRWAEVVTLVSYPEETQDETGGWHRGEPNRRQVFCNSRSISIERRSYIANHYADIGMIPKAEIEVRTCDYEGETEALYRGETYYAEPTEYGDLTTLVLGRRLSDG